jgi:FkbM family methyltransferase
MPERVQHEVDRLLRRVGSRYRTLRLDGFRVLVRRGAAWDLNAVNRIIGDRDYARPGHEIHETDTVIDIGANIGCFALVAGRAARRGRVLAFEPDAENFQLARRNAALNGLSNVTIVRSAVSGQGGTLKLYRGAHGPLHTVRADRVGAASAADEVPALTLPQIMDRHGVVRCGFLKMNCEGAEYGILYGTPPEYLSRIDRIALEYHASPGEDKGAVSRELAAFLQRQGFDLFEFTDFVGFDCGYIRAVRRV